MATTTIKTTFLLRRGTAARWAEVNPILERGEPGFAYDANILKIGDGITPWNDLAAPGGADGEAQIIFVATETELPEIGLLGRLYIVLDKFSLFLWNGSTYIGFKTSVNIDQLTQNEG